MRDDVVRHYVEAEKSLDRAMQDDPDCAEEFCARLRNFAAEKMVSQAKHRAWRLRAMPGDSRSYP